MSTTSCCDIKADIERDYAKEQAVYEELIALAETFRRDVKIYAVRETKEGLELKDGIINSITYNSKGEIIFNVRKCLGNSTHVDFSISTKNNKLFDNSSDMLDYVGEIMDPQTPTPQE